MTLRTLLGHPCPNIESLSQPSDRYIMFKLRKCQRKQTVCSFSIRESILSAIYVLRPLWKSLQFQGHFKASLAVDGQKLGLDSGKYLPSVTFLGSDERPASYATRNCYPVQSQELSNQLDQRLDDLIKSSTLLKAHMTRAYDFNVSKEQIWPFPSTARVTFTTNV